MISPAQCRAARGLLNWSQSRLEQESLVGVATIRRFEGGAKNLTAANMDKIKLCFEQAGIHFIGQTGIDRPLKPHSQADRP